MVLFSIDIIGKKIYFKQKIKSKMLTIKLFKQFYKLNFKDFKTQFEIEIKNIEFTFY